MKNSLKNSSTKSDDILTVSGLTLLPAFAVSYHTRNSLKAALVICILCILSIIAISLIVAAFLRSIFDLMSIGCFLFFILMFISSRMFPLPGLQFFSITDYPVNVNDIFPTTPAITAIDKVMN